VLNAKNAVECRAIIKNQLDRIPEQFQPEEIQALAGRFFRARLPKWPEAPARLCRVDANILNLIRRPERWASVDWENSGWGDPAFEIADLITHPTYAAVPAARQEWILHTYCRLIKGPAAEMRIRTYHKTMLLWWAIRLARYIYENPRGLDERLAARPAGWQAKLGRQYERYLGLAEAAFS
jgi:aminoglycoside phosphotransferase (APT) family kinase protein